MTITATRAGLRVALDGYMPIDLKPKPIAIRQTIDAAKTTAGAVKDAAVSTASAAKDAVATGAASAFDAGKSAASKAVKDELAPFNVHDQLQALQPGDTYKLGGSGEASLDSVAAQGGKNITVTRSATGFTVAGSGDFGIGLTTGEVKNEPFKGESSVFVGAGARSEFTFTSAADAERATSIMKRSATSAPTVDDLEFLRSHLSAVEAKGAGAADLSGKLGVADISLGGGAGVSAGTAVRVEFTNGHPTALAVRQTLGASLSGKASLTAGYTSNSAGGSLDVSATVEHRVSIPPGVSSSKLLSDPVGALAATGNTMVASGRSSVTLSSGGALGQSRLTPGVVSAGVQAQIRFDANSRDALAAVGRFIKTGDYATSVGSLGDATNVSASLATTQTIGISAKGSLGVSAGGASELGFKAGLDATRTHSETVWRYPAPGSGPATLNDTLAKLVAIPVVRPSPIIHP
ncbi:MAG: hypothetical protein QM817_01175 [Archangium sp.]